MPLCILYLHPQLLVSFINSPLQFHSRILLLLLYLFLDLPNDDSLPLYLPLSLLFPVPVLLLLLVDLPQVFDPPPTGCLPEPLNQAILLVSPSPPLLLSLFPVATHLTQTTSLLAGRVDALEETLIREAQVLHTVGDQRQGMLDGEAGLRGAKQRGGVVLHQGDVRRGWGVKKQGGRGTIWS
jgi:hypothetical protein